MNSVVAFITTCTLVFQSADSSIRVHTSFEDDSRYLLQLKQTIEKIVQESYPEDFGADRKTKVVVGCPQDSKRSEPLICILKEGVEVVIQLTNGSSMFTLSYSNLDIGSARQELTVNEYFKDFLATLNTVVFDLTKKVDEIKAFIEEGLTEAGAVEPQIEVKTNDIEFSYTFGELKSEGVCRVSKESVVLENDLFKVQTELSSIDLTILKHEIKQSISDFLRRYFDYRVFELSEDTGQVSSVKSSSCKKVFESSQIKEKMEAKAKSKSLEFKIENKTPTSSELTISGNNKSIVITCVEEEFENYPILNFSNRFEGIEEGFKFNEESFLRDSMYDTSIVGRAYVEYYGEAGIDLLSPDTSTGEQQTSKEGGEPAPAEEVQPQAEEVQPSAV